MTSESLGPEELQAWIDVRVAPEHTKAVAAATALHAVSRVVLLGGTWLPLGSQLRFSLCAENEDRRSDPIPAGPIPARDRSILRGGETPAFRFAAIGGASCPGRGSARVAGAQARQRAATGHVRPRPPAPAGAAERAANVCRPCRGGLTRALEFRWLRANALAHRLPSGCPYRGKSISRASIGVTASLFVCTENEDRRSDPLPGRRRNKCAGASSDAPARGFTALTA